MPLQIRLIDPFGQVRYDLYRATDRGTLRLDLPLAANDPAGDWKIVIRELLSGSEGTRSFAYHPAPQCGALAGATPRAICFGRDHDNIYRLFHTHQEATIVKGAGDYNSAAAERIATVLKPWGVECRIITAAEANKPRVLTATEAAAWAGMEGGRATPGDKNNPSQVGFALRGPAILLGTPEDNPLIKFALEKHMLAYTPEAASLPGRGRGYIGWQRDAVSYREESVTLIAYDAAGMSEAVGSLYEAVAGLNPLTRWELPQLASVAPAAKATLAPEATGVWRAITPDRVETLTRNGAQIGVATADGTVTQIDAAGKVIGQSAGNAAAPSEVPKLSDLLAKTALTDRVVKRVAADGGLTAIGYWGGTVQICDTATGATRTLQVLPADVEDLTWMDGKIVVGLSDGSVVALKP